jgi:putative transcriptional regulator
MNFRLKNKLADCLAEEKIRQSQLARRLDMSPAYVSRLLNGHISPSIETAIRIAQYFDKPVESIFQLTMVDDLPKNTISISTTATNGNQ